MTLTVRPFGAAMRTFLLLMGLLALNESAYAACATPTGTAGDMTYSTSANVMAYCDGANWISMAGGVSLTVNTSGGGATPAGSSADVQFNSSGALAADTGNFTYAAGLLKAPNISTTAITASGAGNFGTLNSSGLGTLGSLIVTGGATVTGQASITTISTSLIQVGNNGAACTSGLAGGVRYNSTSNTIDYCSGSAWLSLGPSSTQPISFSVNKAGTDQTGVPSGSYTGVTFSTKAFDTNNNFNTATGRFTPSVPGKYLLTASVGWTGGVASNFWVAALAKNGSVIAQTASYAAGGGGMSAPVTAIVDANGTTDYFTVQVYQATGSTQSIAGAAYNTYFNGVLLSPQGGGGGGTANPAGSTNDVQFNSGGLLAADTGAFTYASSTLSAPKISTGALTVTGVSSLSTVSASTVSATMVQLGNNGQACGSSISGAMRYTSGTMQVCDGSDWTNVGIGVPQGTISAFALSSCPSGWSEYTPARGRFLRGIDNGAGVDPAGTRSPGNQQADAFQGHGHEIYVTANLVASGGGNGFRTNARTVADTGPFSNYVRNPISDGTNGTPRTANETRPTNVAVIFCQYQGFQSQLATGVATLASLTDVSVAGATNGQVLTYSGGAWVASNTAAGGGVTGGTANYGAIFSGATTLTTDSALYIDRTNHRIGINSDAPGNTLTVSTTTSPLALFVTNGDSINPVIQLKDNSPAQGRLGSINFLNGAGLSMGQLAYATGYNYMRMTTSGTERMRIVSTGEVGISNSNPIAKLDITGTVSASDAIQVGSSSLTCAAGLNGAIRYNSTMKTIDVCRDTTWTSLSSNTTAGGSPAGTTGDIQFNTSGAFDADTGKFVWDKTNDRLGIGTNAPATALDVSGTMRVRYPAATQLQIDTTAASQQAVLGFASNGSMKWTMGKNLDESFFLWDSTGSRRDVVIAPNGNMALMGDGGSVGIGTSTPTVSFEVSSSRVRLSQVGGTNNSPYWEWYKDGTRQAYLGWGVPGTNFMMAMENGNRFDIQASSTQVSGNLTASNMSYTQGTVLAASTDLNTVVANGNYRLSGTPVNSPGSGILDYGQMIVSRGQDTILQIGGDYKLNGYLYFRSGNPSNVGGVGTYSAWKKVLYDGMIDSVTIANNLTATAFLYSSDKRLKSDITELTGGLAKLDALNPVSFRFTADPSKTIHLGLIAQDVQKVYPEAVKADDKGFLKLDYPAIIGPIIDMLKELKVIVLSDHAAIAKLEDANTKLQAANDNLQQEVRTLHAANDNLEAANKTLESANDSTKERLDEVERTLRAHGW